MPKICFLDSKTIGKDIDLSILNELGDVTIYEETSPEEVVERIKEQDIVITNKVILNSSNLSQAKNLKLICITATGTNNVDLNYTKEHGIVVTNVAGYSTHSVIQHTFAMAFYLIEHLSYYDQYVKSKEYCNNDIFTHIGKPFYELKGKTWGIIGLGTIGQGVAKIASAFGCNVIYYSTSGKNNNQPFTQVSLDTLLSTSDIISIHAPLNEKTNNLLTYNELIKMKKSAILLNLGRGNIVNEKDLAKALNNNIIAGAGLDVLSHEPMGKNNPLFSVENKEKLFITPHIAWASTEARSLLIKEVAENIRAFLKGEHRNRV
ncbi:D-2-hydroxyacid dehydrogenase [Defluviitalea phaphyphila]|uniref:D-2-hydroxyacid dehydrogenase n=1 Tax=Defluviitalea phaphyphila TaxID=1473580 RepID=UPI0007300EF9|nr:D-2-hydroxyacid dehydrogenase [Defluviitalea phaphyphila]